MKIINEIRYFILISCFIISSNETESQPNYLNEIKNSLTLNINTSEDFNFKDCIDLLYIFKINEIELLTLEMKKKGRNIRRIGHTSNSIWEIEDIEVFGNSSNNVIGFKGDTKYLGLIPYENSPRFYFFKSKSPNKVDKYKSYSRIQFRMSGEELYKFNIDLRENPNYKLENKEINPDGVISIYKLNKTFDYSFLVQIQDGNIGLVSFLISN